jgi:hypothetical protein
MISIGYNDIKVLVPENNLILFNIYSFDDFYGNAREVNEQLIISLFGPRVATFA